MLRALSFSFPFILKKLLISILIGAICVITKETLLKIKHIISFWPIQYLF